MKIILSFLDYFFYRMARWYKKYKAKDSTGSATFSVTALCFISSGSLIWFIRDLLDLRGNDTMLKIIGLGYALFVYIYMRRRYNKNYIEIIYRKYNSNPFNQSIGAFAIVLFAVFISLFFMLAYRLFFHDYIIEWGLYGSLHWMIA